MSMSLNAILSGRMSTAILKYPTGRYGIVGSVPYELSEPMPHAFTPGQRRSQVFETEQDVIDALLAIGCTRFQLADCTWYQPSPIAEFAAALDAAPKLADAPFTLTATTARGPRGKQGGLF
jgi:hypothetical protein